VVLSAVDLPARLHVRVAGTDDVPTIAALRGRLIEEQVFTRMPKPRSAAAPWSAGQWGYVANVYVEAAGGGPERAVGAVLRAGRLRPRDVADGPAGWVA
jgi:hypothetical protein